MINEATLIGRVGKKIQKNLKTAVKCQLSILQQAANGSMLRVLNKSKPFGIMSIFIISFPTL